MRRLEVFLSYSRQDAAAAAKVSKQISDSGHRVWLDTEEMLAGDRIGARLRRTLRSCDIYVVLVTPHSLRSHWVLIELGGAWIIDVPIFPVLVDASSESLPGPLSELNHCRLDEVPTKLIPALHGVGRRLGATIDGPEESDIPSIVTAAVPPSVPDYRVAEIVPLVANALSSRREVRRLAHTSIRGCAQSIRLAFLDTMMQLTSHMADRVRGEAYFCLGDIPLDSSRYLPEEELFQLGLHDRSPFVQACCANVLRNFVPLEHETVERLRECLTANAYRASTKGPLASLVYYASMTLNADALRRDDPTGTAALPTGSNDHAP